LKILEPGLIVVFPSAFEKYFSIKLKPMDAIALTLYFGIAPSKLAR
jgi:hypothetical protein